MLFWILYVWTRCHFPLKYTRHYIHVPDVWHNLWWLCASLVAIQDLISLLLHYLSAIQDREKRLCTTFGFSFFSEKISCSFNAKPSSTLFKSRALISWLDNRYVCALSKYEASLLEYKTFSIHSYLWQLHILISFYGFSHSVCFQSLMCFSP